MPLLSFIITLFLAAVAMPQTVAAQSTPLSEMPAGTYTLDKTHASLIWKVSHLGLSDYTARFTDFDAKIDFDPQNPTESKVTAEINPMSIETDYPYPEKKDFDTKLITSQDWFNAGEFPEITFTSTAIEQTGENTGTMTGTLDFLGVRKPVTLDVTFNKAMAKQPFSGQPALGFSARGTLMRSEWGMNTYVPNIGDEVEIIIEAEFGMNTAEEQGE